MASTESLTEFLRKRKEEEQQQQVDWTAVRREWLEDLDALGHQIVEWLREPAAASLLEIVPGTTELQEETLGRYVAPTWEIRVGSRVISVVPVGRVIVGGKGRVDLRYGPRKRMLIRTDKGSWKIHERDERGLIDAGRQLSGDTLSEIIRQLLS